MKKSILNLMTLRTAMMLATVIVTFLALPTKALADSSGYCGDPSVNDGQGVSWDFEGNTLAISGSGAMADYANTDDIPWKDYIISEVTIGNEITHIGSYAFVFCDKLTSITIPASVTSIGVGTFISCNKLQTVTFGAGSLLKTIGKEAFQSTKFESITIPSNVESIGDEAFSESKLTSVTIPASVTSIGIKVFDDCKSLSEIKVDEGNEYYKSVEGVLMNKEGTLLIAYPIGNAASSYTIPDNVKTIDINAFYSATNLTSVTIPASVTNIGKLAFGFSGLTSVDISAGVTSIGEYAFQDCESLSSVTIPASVESIDNSAFTGCSSLSTVYLMPTNPPTLGPYAFKDIPDASVFYVRNADYKTATGWSDYSTKMKVMSTVTIGDDLLVTDPDINEGGSYYVEGNEVGVKNAEGSTFNYNTFIVKTASGEAIPVTGPDDEGIYTFTMPAEDVTVTGAWTSGNCTCTLDAEGNFTVTANDPTNGSAMADYNDDDDRPWNTKANDIKTVTVGSGVTSIGKYSFSGCDNLTSATIAASVKNISDKAFVKSGLKAIHFADDSQLEFIGGLSFCKCPMQEITIPASVQTIDAGAFNDCASLQAIHFESGSQLKSIVHNAFEGCNNTSLTSITIPTSVNNIYTLAFGNCTYLETIYVLPSEIPVLGTTAFEGCAANLKFYVHGAAYKTATNWSDYSTKMTVIGTITLATDITATATPTFSYDGTDYYAEGTEVTLAYSGSDELKSFIVKDAEGNSIDVKETNGTFSFQMPASDVTVTSQIKESYTLEGLEFADGMQYATYCNISSKNLTVPEGLKAYAVTGVNGEVVTLAEVDFLPTSSGTTYVALLLYREDVNTNVFKAYEYTGTETAPTTNYLRYALVDEDASDGEFVLYNDEFVKATGTIPAGKRYLSLGSSAASRLGVRSAEDAIKITINGTVTNAYSNDEGEVSYAISGEMCTLTVKPKSSYYHKASELKVTKTVDGKLAQTRGESSTPGYNVPVEVTPSDVSQDPAGETTYTFKVEEPYGYEVTVAFGERTDIKDATVTLSATSYEYDGAEHKPTVSLVKLETTELTAYQDFTVSYPDDCTSPGEKTVTVSGKGIYCGTATKTYTITKDAVDAVIALIDAIGTVEYTDACKAEIDAACAAYNALSEAQKNLVTNFTALTNAEASYANLKEAAEKAAAEQAAEQEVFEKAISAKDYTGTYDGKDHSITVTPPEGATVKYGTEEGKYGTDNPSFKDAGTYTVYYEVSKDDLTSVNGSATVTIAQAEIKKVELNKTALTLEEYNTTKPKVTKVYGGENSDIVLPESDYDITYPETVSKPDDYEITVSAKTGNVTGFATATFTITPSPEPEPDPEPQLPTITKAPTAKTDLVFNNTRQKLIEPGAADHGTMQYRFVAVPYGSIPSGDDGKDGKEGATSIKGLTGAGDKDKPGKTGAIGDIGGNDATGAEGDKDATGATIVLDDMMWGTEIPEAGLPGEYTIAYMVKGDEGYGDIPEQTLKVTIASNVEAKENADGSLTVTGPKKNADGTYSSAMNDPVIPIPATINGKYVTALAPGAFDDDSKAKVIQFPKTSLKKSGQKRTIKINPKSVGKHYVQTDKEDLADYAGEENLQETLKADKLFAQLPANYQYQTFSCGVDVTITIPKEVESLLTYKKVNIANYLRLYTCKVENGEVIGSPISDEKLKVNGVWTLKSNNGVLLSWSAQLDDLIKLYGNGQTVVTIIAQYSESQAEKIANDYDKDNMLIPVTKTGNFKNGDEYTYYMLYNGEFHKIADNDSETSGCKALLRVPTSMVKTASARSLTIRVEDDDEATGIKAMDNEKWTMDNWYDLQGRKIQKPTKKGLYIHNGVKEVVK